MEMFSLKDDVLFLNHLILVAWAFSLIIKTTRLHGKFTNKKRFFKSRARSETHNRFALHKRK